MSSDSPLFKHWPEPSHTPRIPLSHPSLGRNEKRNLARAFGSTQISGTGYFVEKSERQLSEILHSNALVVSNGSVALTLALRALGIGAGDEVIVPSLTYAATASSVVNVGAIPRFVDSNLDSWNIHSEGISKIISRKTKAIVVVDLYGNPAEMFNIHQLARARNIQIVQDSAEAFGAKYLGSELGQYADISTYSFFANKIISCGEGGAVTTKNPSLLEKMRLLRGQGMSPKIRYYFEEPGFNFRLSNLSAAILSAQLDRADELLEKRMRIYDLYRQFLMIEYKEPTPPEDSQQSPWLFSIRLPGISMQKKYLLAETLAKKGIQTRPIFYPLPTMPAFNYPKSKENSSDLASSLISREGLSLPTYPELKKRQIIEICQIINKLN